MSVFENMSSITIKGDYGNTTLSGDSLKQHITFTQKCGDGEIREFELPKYDIITVRTTDDVITGDIIMESSSEFDIDNVRHCYDSSMPFYEHTKATCLVELVEIDASGYIPEKSNNGGAYLHYYSKILKIMDKEVINKGI